MSYADQQKVREVLRTTSSQSQTAESLTDGQIKQSISDADAQIDARLGDRYQVPFTSPVPSVVTHLSENIAAYLADLTYRQGKEYANELSPLYLRYQRAIQMLDRLAKGDDRLPDDTSERAKSGSIVINPYFGDLMTEQDVFNDPFYR